MAVIGSSGTNPPLIPHQLITTTRAFTVPFKVKAVVHVFGGGGGGACGGTADGNTMPAATGGGAGAHAASILELSPGVTYTATCGPGGLKALKYGAGTGSDDLGPGSAGTDSSFSGSGITTITAKAGGAGQASFFSNTGTNGTLAGGLGGTVNGSAGTLLVLAGGAGGSIAKPVNSVVTNNTSSATGGGSVGIISTGFRGGNIIGQENANVSNATGGGGTGGNGGDMPAGQSFQRRVTAGGGVLGGSGPPSNSGGVANIRGSANMFSPSYFQQLTFGLTQARTYGGSLAAYGATGMGTLFETLNHRQISFEVDSQPPGIGGSGNYYYKIGTQPDYARMTTATLFAGGGADGTYGAGNQAGNDDTSYVGAKAGGLCGGGGGAGSNPYSSSSTKTAGGEGGHGAVYIEMLERIL